MMDTEQKYSFLYSDEKCDYCETKTFCLLTFFTVKQWHLEKYILYVNDLEHSVCNYPKKSLKLWATTNETFFGKIQTLLRCTMILDILSPESCCLYFTVKYNIRASEIIYRKQDTGAL